ncbi:MAG: thioredoxin domain-containing protein [Vallitaleaceae bacterium]|nr:thioredoxin domain-containing protein [Vallitaleaceae bacterium]
MVLVVYGDYQCPHCRHAHPLIKQIEKEFSKEILFVFRNFPLAEIHPFAKLAASAAEAAGKQNKFWQMHDIIFENQYQLETESFLDFAKTLNLIREQFEEDLQSKAIVSKIERDFESGVRSGVNGTPTFFLNGTRLNSYNGNYESLKDPIAKIMG